MQARLIEISIACIISSIGTFVGGKPLEKAAIKQLSLRKLDFSDLWELNQAQWVKSQNIFLLPNIPELRDLKVIVSL